MKAEGTGEEPRAAGDSSAEHAAYDVIIVGGGPAGIHAALRLTKAGKRIAIIDDAADLGGQFYRRRTAAVRKEFGDIRSRGTRLAAKVKKTSAHLFMQHTVWSVSETGVVRCFDQMNGEAKVFVADHVIVATGAREEGTPFLGWTSPDVITPGHAMHLAVIDRTMPAARMVVAGEGPFLLAVAAHLANSGVAVDGVVFASRPLALKSAHFWMLRYPQTLIQAAGYMFSLIRHRVPILSGYSVDSVSRRSGHVDVNLRGAGGNTRTLETGLLAYATSFRSNNELHALSGAVDDSVEGTPGVASVKREGGNGSATPVVLLAGDAQSVLGRQSAELRGEIAALRILAGESDRTGVSADRTGESPNRAGNSVDRMGNSPNRAGDARRRLRKAERKLSAFHRYGELQEEIFAPAALSAAEIPDEVIVCRCECVSAGEIRASARLGWNDRNAVKGETRAGMGLCQGRECAHAVTKIVGEVTGQPVTLQPARVPAKPLPIAALLKERDQ